MTAKIKSEQSATFWAFLGLMVLFLFLHAQVDESHRIEEAAVHYNVGNKYAGKDRYEEALAEYDRALRGDKANWRAWFNRGSTLKALGRKQEAIASFRQVLEFNKNMPAALQQLKELDATP